jgi:hypothetical protein
VFDEAATSRYCTNQQVKRRNREPTPTLQFKNSGEKWVEGDRQDEPSENLRGKNPWSVFTWRFHVRLQCGATIHPTPLKIVSHQTSDHIGDDVNDYRSRREECKCPQCQLAVSSLKRNGYVSLLIHFARFLLPITRVRMRSGFENRHYPRTTCWFKFQRTHQFACICQ